MTYYSPTSGASPWSTWQPNFTAPPISTFAAPTLNTATPNVEQVASTATPSPNVEQVASTATPTPQQVSTPNITPTFNPTWLQGLTPALTPYGGRPGATPYQPSGSPAGERSGRSGGASGGGSSGGGASPKPPQSPQKQNPLTINIRNLTYPPRYQGAPGRPAVGDGLLGPGGSPAAYTPGGAAYGAGQAGGVPGLFSGASSNIWLAILFGGVLLYAAVEK